jgi:hypothetical protein
MSDDHHLVIVSSQFEPVPDDHHLVIFSTQFESVPDDHNLVVFSSQFEPVPHDHNLVIFASQLNPVADDHPSAIVAMKILARTTPTKETKTGQKVEVTNNRRKKTSRGVSGVLKLVIGTHINANSHECTYKLRIDEGPVVVVFVGQVGLSSSFRWGVQQHAPPPFGSCRTPK